ncbi:MAG: hypothetical protein UT24_C0019G0040 [Candidatus Woesebacteria bacterium GW2011_GWB1_39_12]|uniref:Uncharacterized protein n=1 Tax=Candidatus Woesebacteria bacterium GW2011_GWB1_39_12 TaxID=1618574 RepID=A0A0G0QE62_9BACT|nr:MAG: hypothetical protein UT24_C0019G0040 [Candidatus Woesebacteria bacterium GW2011_GWB1_39_12]
MTAEQKIKFRHHALVLMEMAKQYDCSYRLEKEIQDLLMTASGLMAGYVFSVEEIRQMAKIEEKQN